MDANENLRQEILAGLEKSGMDATALSRRIGRSKDFVRDFLQNRKRSLAQDAAEQIRGVFRDGANAVTPPEPSAGYRAPPELLGARDFPIYAAVEGGPGAMVVTNDVIEMVQRPWYMRDVAGYGVLVVGESMDPAFKPGDIAIVNPKLPPIRGKNAIFVAGEDHGEFRASIKEYVKQDAKAWHVLQHNPPEGAEKEFTLEKKEWSKALRVVGKYEGG